jgi:hypothetical protein
MVKVKVESTSGAAIANANVHVRLETQMVIPLFGLPIPIPGPVIVADKMTDSNGIADFGAEGLVTKGKIEVVKGLLYGEQEITGSGGLFPATGTVVVVLQSQPTVAITTQIGSTVTKTTTWIRDNLITIALLVGLAIAILYGLRFLKIRLGLSGILSKLKGFARSGVTKDDNI